MNSNDFIFVKKRILNAEESAEYLGIPIQSFYNLIHERKIPYIAKNGGTRFYRCDIKDLHNWIENNKVASEE